MATSTAKRNASQKTPSPSETSESINAQIEAFLKQGGEIQQIDNGVSGQKTVSGPRHITLGNNRSR